MTAQCPVCFARRDDGLLCDSCTDGLRIDLRGNASVMGVAELVDNLHIAQAKEARLGTAAGHQTIKHETLPISPGPMEAIRHLEAILGSWAMDVTGEQWWPGIRGRSRRRSGSAPGPFCPRCVHTSCTARREYEKRPGQDRYVAADAAETLLDNLDGIRKHGAVRDLVEEVTEAIVRGRDVVDPQRTATIIVGPCPEDNCRSTVFAFLPADDRAPARMACYPLTDEKRPDRGVPSPHVYETHQWLKASRRILKLIEQAKATAA